jgi:hypothetical protein
MLHELMVAIASLLLQDGAPAPAKPPVAKPPVVKPAAPVQVPPAPQTKATTKPAKPLVVPTPKPRDPEVPSFRVVVKMPGNRRFTGVITRDRLFNDMARAGAHNTSEVYLRSDKFTLHFVDGVDGDVTLRWNQIKKLDVREVLDAAGVRTIEEEYHRLMIAKREADEEAQRQAEEEAAKSGKPADGKDGAGKEKDKAKEEVLPPLLAEFRPDQGWSPKKKEQIEWRRTVVGTAPDKAEQRFLEVYDEWLPLYGEWQLAHAPESPAAKDGDKETPKEDPKGDSAKGETPKADDAKKDDAKKDDDGKERKKKYGDKEPAPKDGDGR